MQLLGRLEQQLIRNVNEVRNGITVLQHQPTLNSPQVPADAQPVYVPQQVEHDAEYVEIEADLNQENQ
jgi:hypothetical protein